MKFNIQVINVEKKTPMSAKGKPYQVAEIAYKNLSFEGKIESFKINQYAKMWQTASGMLPGQTWTVDREKGESGYNEWVALEQTAPGATPPDLTKQASPVGGGRAQASSYPTTEERAKTQVFIIKQSCLAQAVALLTTGAKVPPSTDLILKQAQEFVDWVVASNDAPASAQQGDLFAMPNDDVDVE